MTTLSIVEYPHPYLRFVCKPLKKCDKSIKAVAEEMLEIMHAEKGNGLSASQVQLPFRLFVMTYDNADFVFINPVINRVNGAKTVIAREGCLSLTDLYLPVPRKQKIRFNAYTLAGDEVNEVVEGDMARILQHEVDHLDGKLIIDKVGDPKLRKKVRPYIALSEQAFERNKPSVLEEQTRELLETYC